MKTMLKAALAAAAAFAALSILPAEARRGADDPAGHVRQCRGCDDGAAKAQREPEARGRAAENEAADDRGRGRGADDRGGDDRGGRGRHD